MFEAGAIFAKIVESARVRPIVFGMEVADVGLPLSYLQCVKFSREGMLKVVKSINSAVEKKKGPKDLEKVFDKWWPELETPIIEAISKPDEAKNATDAFRWWLEENHLMEIPEHCG